VELELTHASARAEVRNWLRECPPWLSICRLEQPVDKELARSLDAGEAEAIQLALERRADIVIIDERRGRDIALQKRLVVTGALGMLRELYRQGWIDDPVEVCTRLRLNGFRVSRRLLERFEELIQRTKLERDIVGSEGHL
jgi:predicted nucleic acid-binding protein